MRTRMSGLHDGIDLAGDGEDQRGLAAAVGAEDRDMLAGADAEVDVVQHDAIAARHVHVFQLEKLMFVDLRRGWFRSRSSVICLHLLD